MVLHRRLLSAEPAGLARQLSRSQSRGLCLAYPVVLFQGLSLCSFPPFLEGTTERLNFHFHALEKDMATHSGVLAWRIPGTGEPSRLPSMGSHRAGHD